MSNKDTLNNKRTAAMDNELYYEALGCRFDEEKEQGGQSLILPDILACLKDIKHIFIPFNCPALEDELASVGVWICPTIEDATAVYWGTPTIVDDKVLFPSCLHAEDSVDSWDKKIERSWSRGLTSAAEKHGLKRIITGLGTGDISVKERLADMGGGRVVSWKNFGDFEDWVLVRNL